MSLWMKIACVGALALAVVSAGPIDEDTYLQALQSSQHPEVYGPPAPNTGFDFQPQPQNTGYNYEPQPQTTGYNYEPAPQPEFQQPEFVSHHPVSFYHEYPKHHGHYQRQPSVPEWLFSKLKLKLNLFTLGKILLKLLIFKKIVKFIGIICLLLFLPKLGALFKMDMPSMDDASAEEVRSLTTDRDYFNERLEESAKQVLKSLEAYAKRYGGSEKA